MVKKTLQHGIPFLGRLEGSGQDGVLKYVYPATASELEACEGLDEVLGQVRSERTWYVVVEPLAVSGQLDSEPLAILSAGFQHGYDWVARDFEDEVASLWLAKEDLQEAELLKALEDFEPKFRAFYQAGDIDEKRSYRQFGRRRLADGKSLLVSLVERNLHDRVTWLLRKHSVATAKQPWLVLADVSHKGDSFGNNALHVACSKGHMKPLKILLQHIEQYHHSLLLQNWQAKPASPLEVTNDSHKYTCLDLASHEEHDDCYNAVRQTLRRLYGHRRDEWWDVELTSHVHPEVEEHSQEPQMRQLLVEGGQTQLQVLHHFLCSEEVRQRALPRLRVRKLNVSANEALFVPDLLKSLSCFKSVVLMGSVSAEIFQQLLSGLAELGQGNDQLPEIMLDVLPVVPRENREAAVRIRQEVRRCLQAGRRF
eukprot:Skav216244  [mRNA]  locus=scaffold20:41524:42798:+ [translate_table: standard]